MSHGGQHLYIHNKVDYVHAGQHSHLNYEPGNVSWYLYLNYETDKALLL